MVVIIKSLDFSRLSFCATLSFSRSICVLTSVWDICLSGNGPLQMGSERQILIITSKFKNKFNLNEVLIKLDCDSSLTYLVQWWWWSENQILIIQVKLKKEIKFWFNLSLAHLVHWCWRVGKWKTNIDHSWVGAD